MSREDFAVYPNPVVVGRQIISYARDENFRIEIPWEKRPMWFELLTDHFAARGETFGANAVLGFECDLEAFDDTIVATGSARYYLLSGPL